jgi:hypothetical protein
VGDVLRRARRSYLLGVLAVRVSRDADTRRLRSETRTGDGRLKGVTTTTAVRYFTTSGAGWTRVLRRTGEVTDDIFLDGAWQPTKVLVDYDFGNDDSVDETTEDQARILEPDAFPKLE